jgi:hypothetical protein
VSQLWGDGPLPEQVPVRFYRWRSSAGETGATIEGLEATVVEQGAIRKSELRTTVGLLGLLELFGS